MPVWLKCKNCDQEFYTARSDYKIDTVEECQNCGGILNKICKNLQRVLNKGNLVEVKVNSEEADRADRAERRARCEVEKITSESIDLLVKDGHFPADISSPQKEIEVSFSRNKPLAGRYYFQTRVKEVNKGDGGTVVTIAVPRFARRQQERRAPRYPVEAEVKYRLVENKADFDEIKSDGKSGESLTLADESEGASREEVSILTKKVHEKDQEKVQERKGKAVDISLSGILVADDPDDPDIISKLDKSQPVSLTIDTKEEKLELTGEIARVDRLEDEKKLGLGIKFKDVSSEEEIQLQKIQMEY